MKIKLMPEYECYPIWIENEGIFDNIDPEELPISLELANRITEWSDKYESTYNKEDPRESGFLNNVDKNNFIKEGEELKKLLIRELNHDYDVILQINIV